MSTSLPARPARATPAPRPAAGGDPYVTFCEGIRSLTGIDLGQYKRPQMERRITTFAERRGTPDLTAYLAELKRSPEEREAFLDRVTINVSQLWRNPEQWTVIAEKILPELAQTGRIRAWSAGCSYGAEAYTVAALCRRQAEKTRALRTEITGTDIDPRMVEKAREGHFSAADARDAARGDLEKAFDRQADGSWIAKPELRKMTRFSAGDLLRMRTPSAAYDLVLCRNTVIYFTEDVRDALHQRLAETVRPGGYLVIGSTERIANASALGLRSTHPFTYRKNEA
jgi:chemotaxis protein methyltransferase CheR